MDIFAPKSTIQWSKVGSEVVILDREMGELLRLNPVAGFIWEQLDGRRTLRQIAESIVQTFAVEVSQAQRDVQSFLWQLVQLEIVEEKSHDG